MLLCSPSQEGEHGSTSSTGRDKGEPFRIEAQNEEV